MTQLSEQVRQLELRMERSTTLLEEIHVVVVGDASHKPMLERVATNEKAIATLERQVPTWKQRALQTALTTLLAAVAGYFGVHLPPSSGGPL